VGKTDLVLGLTARYPLEVVSLDSRQVYAGLRIGTAQPTQSEREACPHHLVDFLPLDQTYSAQQFRDDVLEIIADIRGRGRIPLLVGGAGLYLHVLREGLLEIPTDPSALTQVRAEFAVLSDDEARIRLQVLDPESWLRIPPGDGYRTRRALEIERLTGRTFSEWQREHRARPAGGFSFPSVLLERPREELRERIAFRTDRMLETGWIEETRAALDLWPSDVAALRTLGYREILRWLRGEWSRERVRGEIILRTRQYAKRQETWFRHRVHDHVGTPEDASVQEALIRLLGRCGTA